MAEPIHPRACTDADSLDAPFQAFLDSKAVTGSGHSRSGTYVSQLERIVGSWIEKMERRGIDQFGDLDERHIAQWVDEYLAQRVRAHRSSDGKRGISAGSAATYYDYVSAYLSYCKQWGIIEENPAASAVAREPLPDRPSRQSGDQQFWTPEQRQAITTHVSARVSEALNEDADPLGPLRDCALVYTIGYSGVRGAELLQLPRQDDDRRTGATWADLDLEAMTLSVLGKNQDRELVPLTDRPISHLRRLERLLDPGPDWPLFPTLHRPTLYGHVRDELADRGLEQSTIEQIVDEADDILELCRQQGLAPPAMTTEGARHLLKRLTESAGIDVEGKKSYLTLHGARRGVGEQYYREQSPAAAQRALRHADPRTTSKMYAHIETSELSEIGSEVFEEE